MRGCGVLSFPEMMALEAVKFWAQNSYEHIEVLLGSAEPNGATLYPYFAEELEKLYKAFKEIYKTLDKNQYDENPYHMLHYFIETNRYFIRTLERLKFEGFNGFPILYQVTYHILYEQLYVQEIFKSMLYSKSKGPEDVVIQAIFRKMGLGNSPLNCIYGHMYFWSLIGAEHPSIIMNVTPTEKNQLPEVTIEKFYEFRDRFNGCAYQLSSIFEDLDQENLREVYKDFKKYNEDFLAFLEAFKEDPKYLPEELKASLPDLFYGTLEHIIEEHEYVLALCEKFEHFL
ncbi:BAR domain-containing protein [Vallitalea okinawensis]|uniref:hypothetical protein n=1 Tax=Vallitalea okinawensis TaxID=2078660 RepID=UPI000CFC0A6E|nr:hypothetical protein [Vallitalea okinawensis]